jgi:hypothetical protein
MRRIIATIKFMTGFRIHLTIGPLAQATTDLCRVSGLIVFSKLAAPPDSCMPAGQIRWACIG